jgi:hypothetical protein
VNFLGDKGMIGELFTIGIEVRQLGKGTDKWVASINFQDGGFQRGIEGKLSTKHSDDLLNVCRTVLGDSKSMGITMFSLPDKPNKIYVTELASNDQETWEQIHFAANALGFGVCDCIVRDENEN